MSKTSSNNSYDPRNIAIVSLNVGRMIIDQLLQDPGRKHFSNRCRL